MDCGQELCVYWQGFGCPCEVLGLEIEVADVSGQCCCRWGSAIGKRRGVPPGEWPEFECADCPVHLDAGILTVPGSHRCRRHTRSVKAHDSQEERHGN